MALVISRTLFSAKDMGEVMLGMGHTQGVDQFIDYRVSVELGAVVEQD
jgi:hypothetical protein